MSQKVSLNHPFVSLDHVKLNFGNHQVLKDINLEVYPGEFIGLIGPNGAGKSTLLKLILGLIRPQSGKIKIADAKNTKNLIGYVPQRLNLDPQTPLRGRDLVALGLDGNRWGFSLHPQKRKQKVNEMLEAVEAVSFADSPIGRLSGGEQQRLLIAQSLISSPKLLLLDEPLSNLDIKSSYEIVRLVAKLGKEQGISVIFVTHDMNPLLEVMDRVLYLADGNSVIGTVNEIFQSRVLSQLYGYKVEVLKVNGRLIVIGNESSNVEVFSNPNPYENKG
ncbi:metal ABC transporter ATP-binding protein [Lactovum miscens]|uniref:Zinc/manganese transport system ATP-binding protein n=1 Tax=Lactovum miscens TaxID=190387 RepID=A0A841C7Q8_9LACT|nr:metal ABC transporter ATP-binding protein [Lactovum miscens]MBB5888337.1 zinc/manganese transport system ATP-binding protein [Lactovum miscens]